MELDDLIPYIMCLDREEFNIKGDDNQLLIKPLEETILTLNGITYMDTKAIIVTRQGITIYHGKDLVEKTETEIKEFEIEGYSWELVNNETTK